MKLSNCILTFFIFLILVIVFIPIELKAQTLPSGLKKLNYNNLQVLVEDLSQKGRSIGLRESHIQNKVELKFRQTRINPVEDSNPYFYVQVVVVNEAFLVTVSFNRTVSYKVGDQELYHYGVSTWESSILGTHADNANYILGAIDPLIDKFLNEYLRENM